MFPIKRSTKEINLSAPTTMIPKTVREDDTNDSSGIATNARAKGKIKHTIICPTAGIMPAEALCSIPAIDWPNVPNSQAMRSPANANADSIPARIANSEKAIQIIRRRILSSKLPMVGKRRVIRKDSIINKPMVNSIRIITSTATCDAL